MAHRWTWDKLAKNATRLNPKSRGKRYPYTPKFEVQSYTSGPNRNQKVIVPFVGTRSVMVSLRAWGVTQSSLHKVTLLFHECDIQREDPHSENYFAISYNNEMYWIRKFDQFKNPLTARCTCFTGDTKVLLADGTSKTFKELEGQTDFDVISYDAKQNKLIPATAVNCEIKQYNVSVVKLTLQNGDIIKCTKDHKFLTPQNQWIEAQYLLNAQIKTSKDFIEVINIEEHSIEDVYCLTVPNYGNFVIQTDNEQIICANCADFFYTFAFYNYHNGHCLYGPAPRPYQKKTNRPPRNPHGLVGICKHIYNAWAILRNSGLTLN